MLYGHASMLLLGEGSEATEPYNKYNKIRPHSIRSLQFDQKFRPLSFRPEIFYLFTATRLTRTDGKRPGGITLAPWREGKHIVWDVTCVDLLAPSRVENVSVANPGTAAEDAEELKTAKYVCLTEKRIHLATLSL